LPKPQFFQSFFDWRENCLPLGMGTISNLFPSLANNAGLALAKNAPAGSYNAGFNLSLSQQSSGGVDADQVVLITQGVDTNGDGVESVTMSDGDSAQSAYQSLIESVNGYGDLGSLHPGASGPDTPSQLDPFFNALTGALGDNSGTASIGMQASFPEQPLTQAQATQLAKAPPETLMQFVNSIVETVENTGGASVVATSNSSVG
jgi:hypothetical protein